MKHPIREQRTFTTQLELRAEGDSAPVIAGYAAVFNRRSQPLMELDGFRFVEIVAPGAFAKTLQEADVRALFNHDPNLVLGRNTARTLALAEDGQGLAIEATPPDTTWARDLMESMRRGDINQMSFAFQTVKDRWEEEERDEATGVRTTVRTLLEVKLFDVSVVTYPAYTDTEAQVRSLLDSRGLLTPEPVLADHSLATRRLRLRLLELAG